MKTKYSVSLISVVLFFLVSVLACRIAMAAYLQEDKTTPLSELTGTYLISTGDVEHMRIVTDPSVVYVGEKQFLAGVCTEYEELLLQEFYVGKQVFVAVDSIILIQKLDAK